MTALDISSSGICSEGAKHIATALETTNSMASLVLSVHPLPIQQLKNAAELDLSGVKLSALDDVVVARLVENNRFVYL